jgi:hypothetical protein
MSVRMMHVHTRRWTGRQRRHRQAATWRGGWFLLYMRMHLGHAVQVVYWVGVEAILGPDVRPVLPSWAAPHWADKICCSQVTKNTNHHDDGGGGGDDSINNTTRTGGLTDRAARDTYPPTCLLCE